MTSEESKIEQLKQAIIDIANYEDLKLFHDYIRIKQLLTQHERRVELTNASGAKIKQGQLVNIQNGVISGTTGQETAKESNPVVCNCCGNRNRPVMDSGFCIICEKDATPETYSVKRKFCGDCSQQLPGFYPIDDTDITICDRCIERRR